MKKIDKVLLKYLVYAIPAIIVTMAWGTIENATQLSLLTHGWKHYAWDTLGWIFMIWVAVGFYVTTKMLLSKNFRNLVLKKVNKMEDKDEREAFIIGEASKFAILSTLSLCMFLLFVSIFTINVGRYPKEMQLNGKNGYISIGMNFNTNSQNAVERYQFPNGQRLFVYKGIRFSNSVLLIIIIMWLVLSYQFALRRQQERL